MSLGHTVEVTFKTHKVLSLLLRGFKTIQRTDTPNSRVTMVPNRSRMKPLAKDRKLLRKDAMVNTRENCESCWLQPERKTDRQTQLRISEVQ